MDNHLRETKIGNNGWLVEEHTSVSGVEQRPVEGE